MRSAGSPGTRRRCWSNEQGPRWASGARFSWRGFPAALFLLVLIAPVALAGAQSRDAIGEGTKVRYGVQAIARGTLFRAHRRSERVESARVLRAEMSQLRQALSRGEVTGEALRGHIGRLRATHERWQRRATGREAQRADAKLARLLQELEALEAEPALPEARIRALQANLDRALEQPQVLRVRELRINDDAPEPGP